MLREGVHAVTGSRNETCSLYEWYRVACLFPWPFLFIPLLVVLRTDPRVASFLHSFLPSFMLTRENDLPIFLPLHFDSNSIPDALSSRTIRVSLQRETFSDPEDLSPFDSLINNVLNSSLQGSLNPRVTLFSRGNASLLVRYRSVISRILVETWSR